MRCAFGVLEVLDDIGSTVSDVCELGVCCRRERFVDVAGCEAPIVRHFVAQSSYQLN